jgi:ornithine cyclodeaminase
MSAGGPRVVQRAAIEAALANLDLLPLIEAGFAAYSAGRCNVPPVGELVMEKGEVHIKYGCITGDSHYVIKIASGFYGNPTSGLPSGNGLMLVFSQATGALETVLLDEGHLTDVRTAAAGAIAAKYLAPAKVERIGILGTGVQARLQLVHLQPVVSCRNVVVFGRTPERRDAFRRDMEAKGYRIETTGDPAEVAAHCRLIVTTTASTTPLLSAADIRPGTHISAIGSDTPHKQELDTAILTKASRVVVDSIPQCRLRGEASRALAAGAIAEAKVEEIGNIILGHSPSRATADEITVFDATGVAVQDIQIAKALTEAMR